MRVPALILVFSLASVRGNLLSYYEPGSNAAILATSRGGAASGLPYYTFSNPALLGFSSDGISLNAGYRRFFVGLNTPSYLRDVPGYIAPDISEKNFEVFYGFDGNFSAGFGFYSMDLEKYFSQKIVSLYASWRLDDLFEDSEAGNGDKFSVGISVKNTGISYYPDDYTSGFFRKYSSGKNAVTYDCGVFYSHGIFGFALVGRNLLRSGSLGIYDAGSQGGAAAPSSEFILGGSASLLKNFDLRLDARASDSEGFNEIIPSLSWRPVDSLFILAGINSSQVSSGISFVFGDFSIVAAFAYPYVISDGFGDAAVACGWRFGALSSSAAGHWVER